jgi:Skp family chaperone for outer membrane proteins
MSKKLLFTRSLAIAGMLLAAAATVQSSEAAVPATSAAPAARILTIDMRGILMASKVGQSIQAQADQLKKQAQATLNAEAESQARKGRTRSPDCDPERCRQSAEGECLEGSRDGVREEGAGTRRSDPGRHDEGQPAGE